MKPAFLRLALMLLPPVLILAAAGLPTAAAKDARISALTRDMDCTAYRLTEKRQRIPLTSENSIPGAASAWALLNEGPSPAAIYANNGAKVPLRVFDGTIELFMGDARYSYAVGLGQTGAAVIRVCR